MIVVQCTCREIGLSSVLRPRRHSIGYMGDQTVFTGQKTRPTVSKYWRKERDNNKKIKSIPRLTHRMREMSKNDWAKLKRFNPHIFRVNFAAIKYWDALNAIGISTWPLWAWSTLDALWDGKPMKAVLQHVLDMILLLGADVFITDCSRSTW